MQATSSERSLFYKGIVLWGIDNISGEWSFLQHVELRESGNETGKTFS